MGFTKLFSRIIASSVWNEDAYTCKVWVTLLAMKGREHIAECSLGGLAHQARVSMEQCTKAVAILEAPDPDDSSGVADGRRIEKVQGGWLIINGAAYQDSNNGDERKAYMANYMREYRKRLRKQELTSVSLLDRDKTETKKEETVVAARPSGDLVLSNGDEKPKPKKAFRQPSSYEEFKAYCASRGLNESDTMALYSGWEANGWTRNGKPIQKWKAAVVNWQAYGYLPSQRKCGK